MLSKLFWMVAHPQCSDCKFLKSSTIISNSSVKVLYKHKTIYFIFHSPFGAYKVNISNMQIQYAINSASDVRKSVAKLKFHRDNSSTVTVASISCSSRFLYEQFDKNNEAQICPKWYLVLKNKLRTIEARLQMQM